MVQQWIISLLVFPIAFARDNIYPRRRDLSSPSRVRILDFDIEIVPGKPNLTEVEAKNVRDAAEELFEDYLSHYVWGASTAYDYAGLLGIKSIKFDSTSNPTKSVIRVRGGMVVFKQSTTSTPSVIKIENMLEKSLYPTSEDRPSLTEILKNTELFSDIQSTAMKPFSRQSPAPSSATVSPTFDPSYYPSSVDETVNIPLNSRNSTPATSLSSTWEINSNILAAVSVSTVMFVTFAALIFFRRHIREKSLWNISNQDKFASEEEGPSEKISLFNEKWFTPKIISSLLTASTSNTRTAMVESPRTVIQSFWDSDDESIGEFGPDLKTIKPSIIKVKSTKAVEHDIGQDLINFEDLESILTSSDISVTTASIDSYPSYTNVITDFDLDYAHLDADFEPDTSWNFEDNEPTADMDVDPFYTPVYPNHDTMRDFNNVLI